MNNFNEYPRHFIAGAICPECSEIDTTIVYTANNTLIRHCIHCNFEESAREQVSSYNPLEDDDDGLFGKTASLDSFVTAIKWEESKKK